MNLKINVPEDEQLRSYIKDLIKGQVVSIMREDLKDMVKSIMHEMLEPHLKKLNDEEYFNKIFRETLKQKLDNDLGVYKTYYGNNYTSTKKYIKEFIDENLKKLFLEEMEKKFK